MMKINTLLITLILVACSSLVFAEFTESNLVSPANSLITTNNNISFLCNFTTGPNNKTIINVTLWTNISGTWEINNSNLTSINATSGVTYNFSESLIPDGRYIWNCLAYDNNSEERWAGTNYILTIDTTSPSSVQIISPTSNTWVNTLQITVNGSDNIESSMNYTLYVNGTANATGTGITKGSGKNITLVGFVTDNIYSLIIQVEDGVGHKLNSSSFIFKYDASNPTSEIISPLDSTDTTSATITINGSDVSDSSLSYVIYVNGTLNASASDAVTTSGLDVALTGLTTGSDYALIVQMTDDAGNSVNSSEVIMQYRAATSTSSGGGRSSRSTNKVESKCIEDWVCEIWSPCNDGIQTRKCYDWSGCSSSDNKASEEKSCSEVKEIPKSKETEDVVKNETSDTSDKMTDEKEPTEQIVEETSCGFFCGFWRIITFQWLF